MPLKPIRAIVPVLLLSLGVFVGIAMLPTGAHGQPQGKDKKQKAKQTAVRTVTVASGLWHPWSLAWLPNGDMLVTERNGKLRMVRDNKLDADPVGGVPAVHSVRLSGLMEILPHPKFAQNQFVYLTYTKDVGPDQVATTLARGRLVGHQLVDVKDILVCDSWAGDGGSGSRLAWGADGMLYMTTGASNGNAAQELTSLRGKILRLKDDGTPAPGNPFAGKAGARGRDLFAGPSKLARPGFQPRHRRPVEQRKRPLRRRRDQHHQAGQQLRLAQGQLRPRLFRTADRQLRAGHGRPHCFLGSVDCSFRHDVLHRRPLPRLEGQRLRRRDAGWRGARLPPSGAHRLQPGWDETSRQSLLTDLKQRIRDVRQGPDGLVYVLTDEENGALIRLEPAE